MKNVFYTAGLSRRRGIEVLSLDTSDENAMLEVCEQAAENHYKNHDGWEDRWPITIHLYLDKTGGEVFSAEVELYHEPVFTAGSKTESGNSDTAEVACLEKQSERYPCGCTDWEKQHCCGETSQFAEHPDCRRGRPQEAKDCTKGKQQ